MMYTKPLHTIKDLELGDHLCFIYETEEERRAVLTPFLRQGLERGEKALCIVDDRTAEVIREYLRDSGQLSILTQDEAYMPNGTFDPDAMIALLESMTERALAEGYTALRVTGEMSWALRGLPGSERLIEYEAKLNEFLADSRCLAICQYDRRRFEPEVLLDVLRTHPIAVIGTEVYDNPYYMPPDELMGTEPQASQLQHWIQRLAERKRTVTALRGSVKRYRSFFHTSMDAVFITSKDDRWIEMNEAAVELFGYESKEELQKVAIPNLYARPADREKHIRTIERQGFTKNYAADLVRKDGSIINTLITSVPVMDDEGNIIGFQGTIRDITERKRAESQRDAMLKALRESEFRLRQMADTIGDVFWITEWDSKKTIFASKSYEKIWGRTLQSLYDDPRGWAKAIHPEDRDRAWENFVRLGKGETYDEDYRIIRPEGEVRWIRDRGYPIRNEQGEVTRVVGMAQDITERKRTEEKLKAYSEQMEEMVEERTRELHEAQERLVRREKLAMLGQLAGGVAHELRSPLGVISGAAYYLDMLLAEREPDADMDEAVNLLKEGVETSERIISSLLDFARTRPPVRCRVNVNDVIHETLSHGHLPGASRVEVVLQLDEDLPIILADPDQLDQVFGNLIRNGIQAMPDGGRLTIGTSLGSRQVTVFIADTGVGISEENREKIFEPLFTTKAQGIGLGLAIVKTLVEGHGGTIEVKSPSIVRQAQDTAALRTDDVGKGTEAWALGSGSAQGTTFTVRLPVGISLQEA